ncbi:MAG: carbohydrate kinase, partial [Acidobacteria bacterium]
MNAPRQYTIVGLGEVLWDIFPDGKQLGGAPANFAAMVTALGDRGVIASRVGEDALGEQAINRWRERGVEVSFIQRDSRHGTGTVDVAIDDRGQPEFDITEDVAWDYLEWTPQWQQLAGAA